MKTGAGECDLTVIVVSDFEAGETKTWKDERRILKALARQDIAEPFHVVVVEHALNLENIPEDLLELCPNTSFFSSESEHSVGKKDDAARVCVTPFIAVLDADCEPNPCWLRVLVARLKNQPEFGTLNGRTTYGDETMLKRVCGVLDRIFDDMGAPCETVHLSANGAVYRREILLAHPSPATGNTFIAGRSRVVAMRREGVRFYFDPEAVLIHEFDGLKFFQDFWRQNGYSDMMFHGDKSVWAMPGLLKKRWKLQLRDIRRMGPRYLRPLDWPLLVVLFLQLRFYLICGMYDALRGEGLSGSSFR
jgi:hypothetical protein